MVQHTLAAHQPIFNLPPVVQALCLINIGVFLFGTFFPNLMTDALTYKLAFVPARYTGTEPLDFSAFYSPVTHMFLHAGWMHLSVNMGMLLAFGAGIERALGGRKLLLLYFASGLGGALAQALVYPHTEAPMIGASGAISGLFGGVLMLMYAGGMMGQGYKKLLPFIFIWVGISVFFGFFGMPGIDNPIAWTTHVGGFVIGMMLYKPLSRMNIRN